MDLNPVLSEIQGLSSAAKGALGMAGHTLPTAPVGAPFPLSPVQETMGIQPQQMKLLPDTSPPQGGVSMPEASPRISMPQNIPQLVTGPKRGQEMMTNGNPVPIGSTMGDTAERSRLLGQGPGVENIGQDVQHSTFGERHPFLGKVLGGISEGAGMLGDTLLHAAAPGLERMVPGTEGNYTRNLGRANTALTQDTTNAQKEAQTAEEQGHIPLEAAQTAHTEEETAEMPQQTTQRQKLEDAQVQNLLHPQAKTAFEDWRATNPSAPTADFFKAQQDAKPTKSTTPESQAFDGYLAQGMTPQQAFEKVREKPVAPGAGEASLDRESSRFAKTHEKSVSDADARLEKISDARAMINGSAAAQAVGIPKVLTALVSGQGSGVRITQAELNMIAHARGIEGDFEGFVNRLSGKGVLAPEQQKQLTQILDDVAARVKVKQQIANDALDKINSAGSRDEIVQADKDARQKLTQLEKYGHYEGENVTVKGKPVTINKIHPDGSFE